MRWVTRKMEAHKIFWLVSEGLYHPSGGCLQGNWYYSALLISFPTFIQSLFCSVSSSRPAWFQDKKENFDSLQVPRPVCKRSPVCQGRL